MQIAVLANEAQKEELLTQGIKEGTELLWANTIKELLSHAAADVYIDLLFENNKERVEQLKQAAPKSIFINSVIVTLKYLPANFIRFNGWPTFLKRSIIEVANVSDTYKVSDTFACFNKTTEWVPDIPGFVSARVIAMIINEAYFTLEEKVSTKEEIDIAMKLGTNYPYGPFEWSEKIGLKNIYELLTRLSKTNSCYEPAALLKKESFL